jgi:uncharacterized protein (DUF1684 family)
MKRTLLFLTALLLGSCATTTTNVPAPVQAAADPAAAVADWEKWRANENAVWSATEFAILKIDDAVYLKDGETAWLTTRTKKPLQYRWQMGLPRSGGHVVITYKGGKATVMHDFKAEAFAVDQTQTVKIGKGIDVRFALTQVDAGVNGLRVMVYNQANPVARAFKGLSHFAYDPSAIAEATVEPAPSIEPVDFQTSRGWLKRFQRVGLARFTLQGKPVTLGLYSDETEASKIKRVSMFFLDDLSGHETYGVGRYIDIEVTGLPKTLTIDFNQAYNPNCARSPHYNCPLATDHIPVALRAGEKIPPKH